MAASEEIQTYRVVCNHEEQYSLWPADQPLPLGWVDAGKTGPKDDCLSFIKAVWKDMRPLSLRRTSPQSPRPTPDTPHA
ncbi:MAG TPA: MbtH family protein [Verrucomicrobiota bacterium]|nr:MbtH family protein [Verrucomicrobiota bacterium]HNU52294.1 MbtH family protein [Verrucomicrobiota bacterium]